MTDMIDKKRIPAHIAIIMDGNGRWATARGLVRNAGHKAGVESVRRITAECVRLGVRYLTLYTFSTENWKRPEDEVSALMGLVLSSLEDEIFMKHNVGLKVIGDMQRLPADVREKLLHTIDRTKDNDTMTLVVALSYSSRWEITQAVKDILKEAQDDYERSLQEKDTPSAILRPEDITEEFVNSHLTTSFMPDPDLLIRTGGELRISNYLLWQIAYSELYFCDTYWPDFDEKAFHEAIISYQSRQRRFGKTEEQVENENK